MPEIPFRKACAGAVQRLRVPVGFLLLAAFAWLSTPSRESILLGVAIALPGLALRAWAAGHLAKDKSLAVSGPYAFVRNPLYLGSLIATAGMIIAARNLSLSLLFAAAFAGVYLPVISLEEEHLRRLFPEYAAYAERVPALWPKWPGAIPAQPFRGSLYRRNQEYQALAAFLAGVAWLVWKAT